MTRTAVTIRLDDSLYALIAELARDEQRTVPNFIEQLLNVSLAEPLDRKSLFERMNPAFTAAMPAILKERERLEALLK